MRCEAVSVNVSRVDGSVVVDVDGELDALSAPILSGILHGSLPRSRVDRYGERTVHGFERVECAGGAVGTNDESRRFVARL